MIIVPVILAGGIGERFWPLSRSSRPKQLLKLTGSKTMVEETLLRVTALCKKPAKPLIITGKQIARQMKAALPPHLPCDLLVEPVGKNTAPAIALAAAWIQKKYGDAIMVVLSADHAIKPKKDFQATVRTAINHAQKSGQLVVFGIEPSRPDIGYGYIHYDTKKSANNEANIFRVKKFVEKPTFSKAESFLQKGGYLWNSGMFVWKTSTILAEFAQHMPEIFSLVKKAKNAAFTKAAIDAFYRAAPKESIDYGIMEQCSKVCVVTGTFKWDDIGSWESMSRIHTPDAKGTVTIGKNNFAADCSNTIVVNHAKLSVATIGLKNVVVVTTDDAIMVVDRSKLPELKKYLATMKEEALLPAELF